MEMLGFPLRSLILSITGSWLVYNTRHDLPTVQCSLNPINNCWLPSGYKKHYCPFGTCGYAGHCLVHRLYNWVRLFIYFSLGSSIVTSDTMKATPQRGEFPVNFKLIPTSLVHTVYGRTSFLLLLKGTRG